MIKPKWVTSPIFSSVLISSVISGVGWALKSLSEGKWSRCQISRAPVVGGRAAGRKRLSLHDSRWAPEKEFIGQQVLVRNTPVLAIKTANLSRTDPPGLGITLCYLIWVWLASKGAALHPGTRGLAPQANCNSRVWWSIRVSRYLGGRGGRAREHAHESR